MLTITFDPASPQGALETARELAALLADATTGSRDGLSEDAAAGAGHAFGAICGALDSAIRAINAFMRDASGAVAPMTRRAPPPAAPLGDAIAAVAKDAGLSEAEVKAMVETGRAAIRADTKGRVAVVLNAGSTPRLTEPRAGKTLAARIVGDAERETIFKALEACGGDRRKACAALGIHPRSLWRKLRSYEAAGHPVPRLVDRKRGRKAAPRRQAAA
jgi:DNA-binding NtrC family response regulator